MFLSSLTLLRVDVVDLIGFEATGTLVGRGVNGIGLLFVWRKPGTTRNRHASATTVAALVHVACALVLFNCR